MLWKAFNVAAVALLSTWIVFAGPPAPPARSPKSGVQSPKVHAAPALSPKQQSIAIVKTAVVATNPVSLLVFTNRVPAIYSTNPPAAWLEIWEYSDDGGATWRHKAVSIFTPTNEILVDMNAPGSRWYLLTYASGVKPVNNPATTP